MKPKHTLKCESVYFEAARRGEKTFEVRLNDRGFQPGDLIRLDEIDKDGDGEVFFTGDFDFYRIGWMLQGGQFGIAPGYCVFSLDPYSHEEAPNE